MMNTDTRPIYLPQRYQLRGATASMGRLLWHFVQMILVMEAGMLIYHHLLWPILAPTGYAALTSDYPLFGYWMMVLCMTLPMLAFMRVYHRPTWNYCLGMTLAMFAPLAVLTVLAFGYLIPIRTLYTVGDPFMFVAMGLYMFYCPYEHPCLRLGQRAHPRIIHIPVMIETTEQNGAWNTETQLTVRVL